MEEHWMWYLTGMVDSVGVFSGKIKKDDEFSIGYRFTPTLSISRNEKKEVVLGMVDEYCEDHGSDIPDRKSDKWKFADNHLPTRVDKAVH